MALEIKMGKSVFIPVMVRIDIGIVNNLVIPHKSPPQVFSPNDNPVEVLKVSYPQGSRHCW